MSYKYLKYIILVLIIAATVLIFDFNKEENNSDFYLNLRSYSYNEVTDYLKENIKNIGPEETYKEVYEATKELASGGHNLGHAFGTALYDSGGLDYFNYCGDGNVDDYGCYHQFIGLAVSEFGTNELVKLKKACEILGNNGGCSHGIGHSLTALYGYDQSGMKEALDKCSLIYTDDLEGMIICSEGVFMEYNLLEIAVAEAGVGKNDLIREYSIEDPYKPCEFVNKEFQPGCVFELPLWWSKILPHDSKKELFSEIGGLCRSLPESLRWLSTTCFGGIGYSVYATRPNSKIQVDFVVKSCGITSNSEFENNLCLFEVASRYHLRNQLHFLNERPCKAFGLTEDSLCEEYVDSNVERRIFNNSWLLD